MARSNKLAGTEMLPHRGAGGCRELGRGAIRGKRWTAAQDHRAGPKDSLHTGKSPSLCRPDFHLTG